MLPASVHRDDRFHPQADDDPRETRSAARRDRDRILYSSAFRRLSGITQVVAPTERYPIHNRLTHTLKVAQIARSLAENLLGDENNHRLIAAAGGLDADVAEAAALAHDLGHPPFGHVAERALDELVLAELRRRAAEASTELASNADGFEGNAQTFRILTRLSVRYPEAEGLNLTRATLCAVLKYPWTRADSGPKRAKWGAYRTEAQELVWARALLPSGSDRRSLEAGLMDWSDDVAYAVHDLEDFFRAGLIPLDRLATDRSEQRRFVEALLQSERERPVRRYSDEQLTRAFYGLMGPAPVSVPFRGDRFDRYVLRSFTSGLIARYVRTVRLRTDPESGAAIAIDPDHALEVAVLQALTRHYVIESRSLVTQRFGQSSLIRSLFKVFVDAIAIPQDWHIFPAIYRESIESAPSDEGRIRVVADLISSMSESQVVEVHHRLTGLSLGSAMDPVLP